MGGPSPHHKRLPVHVLGVCACAGCATAVESARRDLDRATGARTRRGEDVRARARRGARGRGAGGRMKARTRLAAADASNERIAEKEHGLPRSGGAAAATAAVRAVGRLA
eukprot:344419-Pleurochrysis_carterae.AAC.1